MTQHFRREFSLATDDAHAGLRSANWPLALFLAVVCVLTVKSEYVLAAAAVYATGMLFIEGRDKWVRHFASIDRHVLYWCTALLVLWAYGFALGLAGGWPNGHVVRNFFGLATFLPLLLASSVILRDKELWPTIIVSSVLATVGCVALRVLAITGYLTTDEFRFIGIPNGISEYGVRLYTFGVFLTMMLQALVALKLYEELSRKRWARAALFVVALLLLTWSILFVTDSKGMLLGSLAVLVVPFAIARLTWSHLTYALVVAVTTVVAVHTTPVATRAFATICGIEVSADFLLLAQDSDEAGLSGPMTDSLSARLNMFGASALGNLQRYEQIGQLLADTTWWGRGLGAPISTGYARSEEFPYGFELSYLNVVHKFGLFSLLYFAFLIYTVYRIWRSPASPSERAVAFGALTYLAPAVGNPINFAIQLVLLHVLALHAATRRRP